MLRVCVFLVSLCVFGAGSFSGRGFFCRDPDTGMLHPVNTTWPATTFCGNYHCKLRRKNLTGTVYAPLRQINITNVKILGQNLTKAELRNETEKRIVIVDKAEPVFFDGLLPLDGDVQNIDDKNDTEPDRYLSEKEIKSLTELLHSVKKSDLEAIVEIYNLAQDIYKEIDKTSTDHVLDEAMYTSKIAVNHREKSDVIGKTKKHRGHVSYWYEPLSNTKIRPADILRPAVSRPESVRNDMMPVIPAVPADVDIPIVNLGDAVNNPSRVPVTPAPPTQTSLPFYQMRKITDTFFNGPLSNKDFGKLPYYYPMSSFQRLSSYMHEQSEGKKESAKPPVARPTYKSITYNPKYTGAKYQKEIKPSILLPYPFSYINHYNWTYSKDLFDRQNYYEQANVIKNRLRKTSNAVLMNPDLENFQDLQMKPSQKDDKVVVKDSDEDRIHVWQTDPLPSQILDEVRAHVQDKQKFLIHPFPLRKKIKLERVGKLRKMDEGRNKRAAVLNVVPKEGGSLLEPELFEVYIERTTCNSDYSVPGYFRYGNLSQPYPDCCPQRITR